MRVEASNPRPLQHTVVTPLVTKGPRSSRTRAWHALLTPLALVTRGRHITDPTVCFDDPSNCMVFDYGEQSDWEPAGGSRFYFTVLPTLSVVNRCIPIANVRATEEPPHLPWPRGMASSLHFPW